MEPVTHKPFPSVASLLTPKAPLKVVSNPTLRFLLMTEEFATLRSAPTDTRPMLVNVSV